MAHSGSYVQYKRDGYLAVVSLNRPSALNALNADMLTDLKHYIEMAVDDDQVRSIWLTSTSEKAFCAGGDVKQLVDATKDLDSSAAHAIALRYFALEYELDGLIHDCPKPVVAFADGLVFGGGWGLFAGAQLRLATEHATFAMPESQIGFFPDVGAAGFLQQSDWKVGTFLGLSGCQLRARDALSLGYVDDIVAIEQQAIFQAHLAQGFDIAELALEIDVQDVSEVLYSWQNHIEALPDTGTLSDWLQIIAASSDFPPFVQATELWRSASPLSLMFTWHYFRQCRSQARLPILGREAAISARFSGDPEFIEGVTAKLIEKRPAQWRHDHIESVALEDILSFMN